MGFNSGFKGLIYFQFVNGRKSDDGVVVTALKGYIWMNGHPESTEKV